jgi:hypothetical protein
VEDQGLNSDFFGYRFCDSAECACGRCRSLPMDNFYARESVTYNACGLRVDRFGIHIVEMFVFVDNRNYDGTPMEKTEDS